MFDTTSHKKAPEKLVRDSKGRFVKGITPSNRIKVNLTPTEDLAYVIGVLKGDGSLLVSTKKRTYGIQLNAKDEDFCKAFYQSLKAIGLRPHLSQPPSNNGLYRVTAYSKEFYEWYSKLTLEDLEKMLYNESLIKAFLRGYFDSEGSVSFNRYGNASVRLSSTDGELIKFVQRLLLKIGIRSTIYFEEEHNCFGRTVRHYTLNISKSQAIAFREKVGTNIQRKMERLSKIECKKRAFTKEELDFLIQNYGKMTLKQIAMAMNRNYYSLYNKVRKLKKKGVLPSGRL